MQQIQMSYCECKYMQSAPATGSQVHGKRCVTFFNTRTARVGSRNGDVHVNLTG